ncbi:sulfatase-like hydrolase/transferase [Bacteroidota bacterium]
MVNHNCVKEMPDTTFMKTMVVSRVLLSVLIYFICLKVMAAPMDETAEKPNILIIFTDDQGFADLGCYGSKTNKTPNMDQLAKDGTMFTNFYAQPVCGPSRSALLTGRYPIRSKGWDMPKEEITFGELIRGAGYQTACIGKWDVSNRKPIIDRMPNAQGFDYYFGTLGANDNGSVRFHENNILVDSTDDMASLTRLYTDKAMDYLKNKRDKKKPFILYLAHTMMHTIIDASPEFKGKSRGDLYGDVVEEFDHETGRLLNVVDALELRENTLIIYTTDNGPWNQSAYTEQKEGHPEGSIFWGNSGPLRNGKGSCYEGGSRVPCIISWPGKIEEDKVSNTIFATVDFLPTFAHLAGFKVPEDRVIDGVNQTDLLVGRSTDGARETYYYQGNGVRNGKWKFLNAKHNVYSYARDKERIEVEELYNLESDIGESNNLADSYPEKIAELKILMKAIEEGEY